ncbi:hypothetical protein [Thalassoroseus pseudoceratinae]|uniref:hypothetical protein n=1 Tax=Thalassoroseus pseudoceratinae TaxID=2713176 RepID=UPI0014221895|nr:hypothetical protein [Thalassoroseus pseudoceratinae]
MIRPDSGGQVFRATPLALPITELIIANNKRQMTMAKRQREQDKKRKADEKRRRRELRKEAAEDVPQRPET